MICTSIVQRFSLAHIAQVLLLMGLTDYVLEFHRGEITQVLLLMGLTVYVLEFHRGETTQNYPRIWAKIYSRLWDFWTTSVRKWDVLQYRNKSVPLESIKKNNLYSLNQLNNLYFRTYMVCILGTYKIICTLGTYKIILHVYSRNLKNNFILLELMK